MRAPPGKNSGKERRAIAALCAILIIALGLRLYCLPRPEQALSCDERNYIFSGAVLWEGILPSYKIAPAGATTWVSWAYCAVASGIEFIRLGSSPHPLPYLVRPYQAIQDALFDVYRNPIPLKLLTAFLALAASLLAVAAGFRIGEKKQGLLGGIIASGILAFMPVIVQYSVMPTPYAFSWAFAVLSLYFCVVPSQPRWLASGIMLGAGIATRMETVMVLPLILWELQHRDKQPQRSRIALRLLAGAAITAILVSPWLAISLIEILRTLVVIRLSNPFPLEAVWKDVVWNVLHGGLGILLLLCFICVPGAARGKRAYTLGLAGYVLFMFSLTFIRNTVTTSRYDGPLYISLVLAAPVMLSHTHKFRRRLAWALGCAGLCLGIYTSCNDALYYKQNFAPQHAVSWIEQNVPAGTKVYMPINLTFTTVLPTPEASDRLWERVNGIAACGKKFNAGACRLGVKVPFTPRAYCEEVMHMDQAVMRRWFILGGERTGLRAPRYDLRPYPVSLVIGPTMTQSLREFLTAGGVFVAYDRKVKGLDKYLAASWESPSGKFGEYIYIRTPTATGS